MFKGQKYTVVAFAMILTFFVGIRPITQDGEPIPLFDIFSSTANAEDNYKRPISTDTQEVTPSHKYSSILVTNHWDNKSVELRKVHNKIYDLSFLVYTTQFAEANNLPIDPFYIDDTLPDNILAIEIDLMTDHARDRCELKVLLQDRTNLKGPSSAMLETVILRGNGFHLPRRNNKKMPSADTTPFEMKTDQLRGTGAEYAAYISSAPLLKKDLGHIAYMSTFFSEYSSDYFSNAKYFRFNVGCSGIFLNVTKVALNAGNQPIISMVLKPTSENRSKSDFLGDQNYLSFSIPRKLMQRVLPWLNEMVADQLDAKGRRSSEWTVRPPGQLMERQSLK